MDGESPDGRRVERGKRRVPDVAGRSSKASGRFQGRSSQGSGRLQGGSAETSKAGTTAQSGQLVRCEAAGKSFHPLHKIN